MWTSSVQHNNNSVSLWRGSTKRSKKESAISPSRRIRSIAREGERPASNIRMQQGKDEDLEGNFLSFALIAFAFQLKMDTWAPDFGPATFVPSWGATVTGARKFLIAYNVNLISTKEQAHRIALDIREQGRGKDQVHAGSRFSVSGVALCRMQLLWSGLPLVLQQPGVLTKVQGIGWYLDEANIAQVSTNILDYEVTSLHMVYEEICRDAKVWRWQCSFLKMDQKLPLESF